MELLEQRETNYQEVPENMINNSSRKLAELEQRMADAEAYDEWCEMAQAYDRISSAEKWKQRDQTRLYNYSRIRHRLDELRRHRARQDDHALMFTLNEGIHGNMGGMGKASLYQPAEFGTKHLIEDYVSEIVDALEHICDIDC